MAAAVETPRGLLPARPRAEGWTGVVQRLRKNRLSMAGSAIVILLVAVALFAPYLGLADPVKLNVSLRFTPPGPGHWFGTDHLGRDLMSRVLYGARFSLVIGALTILAAGVPGVLVGILGAAAPVRVSASIMRLMDVLMSFPPLLLAIAVAAAVGTGGRSIVIALSVVYFPRIVRVTRAIALSVLTQEYVTAAFALGTPGWRLIGRTVLPNCLSVVIVQLSLYFAEVLLAEAALSFLGLGESPPRPTWGNMLYDAQKNMRNAPWIAIFPGAAIAVSVLGLNLFGDAVRDLMDPRMRT
ncbi:MAG TPA: ABC transporter permease [Methylomirabilota bacterium]|jgi:peptide/nickel transport system permease protein|nr:ABC transporter permease [Methylomirabilota bacterium]